MSGISELQAKRYNRQIIMPQVGEAGQERLLKAKVLVIGAGGLGSPAIYYLAAAGVGNIGVVDQDAVELSNLQRQILHDMERLGTPKAVSAQKAVGRLNPDVMLRPYVMALNKDNAEEIIQGYEVVVNAVDNGETRQLVNAVCVKAGKPLVEGGVTNFSGYATTIVPGQGPCYRCIFPNTDRPAVPTIDLSRGVIGALPGVVGSMQALETIKLLLGIGELLVGRLLVFDGLSLSFREVKVERRSNCQTCASF